MLDESGNLLNFNGSSLPWEKEFKAYCGTGQYKYVMTSLSGLNKGLGGTVTASVYYKKFDNISYVLFKTVTNTGYGAYSSITGPIYP